MKKAYGVIAPKIKHPETMPARPYSVTDNPFERARMARRGETGGLKVFADVMPEGRQVILKNGRDPKEAKEERESKREKVNRNRESVQAYVHFVPVSPLSRLAR